MLVEFLDNIHSIIKVNEAFNFALSNNSMRVGIQIAQ